MVDFGYYTIPGLLMGLSFGLYWWQEPRMKSLEEGRSKKLDALAEELVGKQTNAETIRAIRAFLETAQEKEKDLLMPIRKFTPYRKISRWLTTAFLLATICVFFNEYLETVTFGIQPDVSALAVLVSLLLFFCVLPAKWLWDEFRYMQRITSKLE